MIFAKELPFWIYMYTIAVQMYYMDSRVRIQYKCYITKLRWDANQAIWI